MKKVLIFEGIPKGCGEFVRLFTTLAAPDHEDPKEGFAELIESFTGMDTLKLWSTDGGVRIDIAAFAALRVRLAAEEAA